MSGEKKIKIVMVGPHPEGLGGISRVIKNWEQNKMLNDENVRYIPSSDDRFNTRFLFLLKNFIRFLVEINQGISWIYIHTSSYNSFLRKSIFILGALMFRKKMILHIHPNHFAEFMKQAKGISKTYLYFLLSRIDRFVVLTIEMEKNIKEQFPNKPLEVLRNPVDIQLMRKDNCYVRQKNNILYMGWYLKEKGVYDLVDAIGILTREGVDLHLNFYGRKGAKILRRYIENKNLVKYVSVNGWVDGEEKLKSYYTSTMLVLPSYSEGIPNVILEAMATRTPIVSTHVGGLKEVLVDGNNAIIFETGNCADLSKKILKCLKDESLRKKISEQAYEDVVKNYDIQIVKKKFSGMIQLCRKES